MANGLPSLLTSSVSLGANASSLQASATLIAGNAAALSVTALGSGNVALSLSANGLAAGAAGLLSSANRLSGLAGSFVGSASSIVGRAQALAGSALTLGSSVTSLVNGAVGGALTSGAATLATSVGSLAGSATTLVSDATSVASGSSSVMKSDTAAITTTRLIEWGLYKNGAQVLKPDSVLAFEYRREWQVPDYPQESGAFQSYNKVAGPYAVRLTMSKGGQVADRSEFLNTVETVAASLDLYDAVTPEKLYLNMTIERFDYRRTATNGAGLITVEMWLAEIRDAAAPIFVKSTKQPSGASPVNGGTVQARAPTAAEKAATATAPAGN